MNNKIIETGKLKSDETTVSDLIEVLNDYKEFYGNQVIRLNIDGFKVTNAQLEYFKNGISIDVKED